MSQSLKPHDSRIHELRVHRHDTIEKLPDLLGACTDLSFQDVLTLVIANGHGDLLCMLIDGDVQHQSFSW